MVRHFIIIASSYKMKKRIAVDFIYTKESKQDIAETLQRIKKECGQEIQISTHSMVSETKEWQSVVEADPFFDDIAVLDSIEQFIMYANQNKMLTGNEIGEYVLSKVRCDHLKLQKLVYLSFAEYLCKTGKVLFDKKIYAFKFGPVVDDVYSRYKNSGSRILNNDEGNYQLALESRILNSEDGINKLNVINEVINKYAHLSADRLVSITHKEGSPWQHVYDGTPFKEIPVDIIRCRHCCA